ncbi:DUF2867 domain-containing protein [Alginatibacterium sediminis]|uniref:DUF2867 domain-containing protein n=1 Tax=Alginatibacterium sediminis TaxID=2164068 RepID=A0A420EHQ5_9ALTE|nr:DUF2867 domain-containing protein [Alginatibacterium sediminis]RKF20184.1 DUF2867 domain-containing protein [Alginatibacterium sediminis]
MRILVIGALGTVGRNLVPALVQAGHEVSITSRDPEKSLPWRDLSLRRFTLDLLDADSLPDALEGHELVYYLMHGMSDGEAHTQREVRAAKNLSLALPKSSVKRVIYLGSLVSLNAKSEHMRARVATGKVLAASQLSVIEVRAGIVIAPGSAAFEVMRDIVGHVPLILGPESLDNCNCPIAIDNLVVYLIGVSNLTIEGHKVFDAVGPRWVSYRELMLAIAKQLTKKRKIIAVKGFPTALFSKSLGVITSVPSALAQSLVAGLNERLVAEPSELRALIPQDLIPLDQALKNVAIQEQVKSYPQKWRDGVPTFRNFSALHGFYAKCASESITIDASRDDIWQVINMLGGPKRYFYGDLLWAMREWMDWCVGGNGRHHGRDDSNKLVVGQRVDSWTILSVEEKQLLVMRFGMKAPGGGGMQLEIKPTKSSNKQQLKVSLFWHPAGFSGLVYWYFFAPWHQLLLRGMTKEMSRLAQISNSGSLNNLSD